MAYSKNQFQNDAEKTALALHLAYRKCHYLLHRWYAGMNGEFPSSTHPELNNLMTRVAELVADYEANSNAKLNTVLELSPLVLPGDEDQ